jgi:DNA primase
VVRLAIAMLLQHPSLAERVHDESGLANLDLPGMNLFLAVLQVLKSTPRLNTASVVESFRDSEHQHNIAKLAVWQHPVLEQNVELEFTGLMDRLREISAKQRIERLLQRQRSGEANQAEKAELARLLMEKKETARLFPSRH